jgi:hypothetical protein
VKHNETQLTKPQPPAPVINFPHYNALVLQNEREKEEKRKVFLLSVLVKEEKREES